MSEVYVTKRDGRKVPFSKEKLERWAQWAAEKGADWESILSEAIQRCPNGNKTSDFHQAMISVCVDKATSESLSMAGRLVLGDIYKQAYGEYFRESGIPDFKTFYTNMVVTGLWDDMGYTDEELIKLNNIIDHNKDLNYSYTTIKQIKDKYLVKDKVKRVVKESPQMMYMGMALAIMQVEPIEKRVNEIEKYYHYLSDLKINMPTPSHNSLRTKFKGLASCVLFKTNDTADSISAGNHIAYTMTAAQAGIGGYMETRSVGDSVDKGRVVHSGKIPYYKYFESAVKSTKQSSRSGSITMYYNCLDPELMDLLRLKGVRTPDQKRITTMDYSFQLNRFFVEQCSNGNDWMLVSFVNAPRLHSLFYSGDIDEFKREYYTVLNDENIPKKIVKAMDVVREFLIQRQETGRIYCAFMDTVNLHTPFKDKIYSSNLCVAPETTVLTRNGHETIKDLCGKTVDVWNGVEWSTVDVVKTGENQELLVVNTSFGQSLTCTKYHKFYVKQGNKIIEKRAHELLVGDKLIKSDYPIINGDITLENAYINGFFTGDGCNVRNKQRIYLYGEKRKLKDSVKNVCDDWIVQENQDREYGHTTVLMDKFYVPTSDITIASKLDWLAGLCDADGTISRNGKTQSLQITSVNFEFLSKVQMLLQTLGVFSKINSSTLEGERLLPLNNGSGEMGLFWCKNCYRLLIGQNGVKKLKDLGFNPKRLVITDHTPNRECNHFVKITSVVDSDRIDDTYCFTEPKRGMAVFNGILTGQCAEVTLPTEGAENVMDLYTEDSQNETAICFLAATNLGVVSDDEYEDVVYYALKGVDRTMDIMEWELPNLGYKALKRRSVGIGMTDLAHYMAKNMLSYKSIEGKKEIHRLAERHSYFLHKASLRLGKECGNSPWIDKTKYPDGWLPIDTANKEIDKIINQELLYDWETLRKEIIANGGIRNSVLEATAPYESSSQASNTTNSLYPVRDLKIVKKSGNNTNIFVVPDYDDIFVREAYELAWGVPVKDMIELYAIVQKFHGQAISSDFYIDYRERPKVSLKEWFTYLEYASRLGMKTWYYTNSKTMNASDIKEDSSCVACKM